MAEEAAFDLFVRERRAQLGAGEEEPDWEDEWDDLTMREQSEFLARTMPPSPAKPPSGCNAVTVSAAHAGSFGAEPAAPNAGPPAAPVAIGAGIPTGGTAVSSASHTTAGGKRKEADGPARSEPSSDAMNPLKKKLAKVGAQGGSGSRAGDGVGSVHKRQDSVAMAPPKKAAKLGGSWKSALASAVGESSARAPQPERDEESSDEDVSLALRKPKSTKPGARRAASCALPHADSCTT